MSPSDNALAGAARDGNQDAFATLVDRHKQRVYRTLFLVVGDEQDAQDLSQEVFLKVYRFLTTYKADAAFTTWLHRVTVNTATDWLRTRRRRPLELPLEPVEHSDDHDAAEPISSTGSAEESALRREKQESLRQALARIAPEYREVLLLRHSYHLSYQAIAERIDAPVRTVETRLYRGRSLLKAALESVEGGEVDEMHGGASTARCVLGRGAGL